MITQNQMLQQCYPLFQTKGKLFKKYKEVLARRAKEGEKIVTTTSDGEETQNVAHTGDMVVMNQTAAKEQYVMSRKKFKNRYRYICRAEGSYNRYRPQGKVVGVELTQAVMQQLNIEDTFCFEAPWGETMIAKQGDFIVMPTDSKEIYRIARKEFFETYEVF